MLRKIKQQKHYHWMDATLISSRKNIQSWAQQFMHQICTLELSDVEALFNNDSLSDNSTGVTMPSKIWIAFSDAFWKASDMLVGWIPDFKKKLWRKSTARSAFSISKKQDINYNERSEDKTNDMRISLVSASLAKHIDSL